MIDSAELCCVLMDYGPATIMVVSIVLGIMLVQWYGKTRNDPALTGRYRTATDILRDRMVNILVIITIMAPFLFVLYLFSEFYCEWSCS